MATVHKSSIISIGLGRADLNLGSLGDTLVYWLWSQSSPFLISLLCRYFGYCLFAFVELLTAFYGGRSAMLATLQNAKMRLNSPPCCCLCFCLKPVPFNPWVTHSSTHDIIWLFDHLGIFVILSRPHKRSSQIKVDIYNSPMMTSSKETFSTLPPFCVGKPPVTGGFPPKDQWCGALMFSLICAWTNAWASNLDAGDLRRNCAPFYVTVMQICSLTTFQ